MLLESQGEAHRVEQRKSLKRETPRVACGLGYRDEGASGQRKGF